jgi:hypothetical protein
VQQAQIQLVPYDPAFNVGLYGVDEWRGTLVDGQPFNFAVNDDQFAQLQFTTTALTPDGVATTKREINAGQFHTISVVSSPADKSLVAFESTSEYRGTSHDRNIPDVVDVHNQANRSHGVFHTLSVGLEGDSPFHIDGITTTTDDWAKSRGKETLANGHEVGSYGGDYTTTEAVVNLDPDSGKITYVSNMVGAGEALGFFESVRHGETTKTTSGNDSNWHSSTAAQWESGRSTETIDGTFTHRGLDIESPGKSKETGNFLSVSKDVQKIWNFDEEDHHLESVTILTTITQQFGTSEHTVVGDNATDKVLNGELIEEHSVTRLYGEDHLQTGLLRQDSASFVGHATSAYSSGDNTPTVTTADVSWNQSKTFATGDGAALLGDGGKG